MKIRIKFKKFGAMKFIGHLDVMRYFQKAIRRADVNIRYSEGYSPHQVMSFAAPLGVGVTSNGEYVDIEVLNTGSSKEMVERLNKTMSEGFEVTDYRQLPDDAANAMSIVAAADYTLCFRPGYEPKDMDAAQWFHEIVRFFDRPEIIVLKKTKKGEKEINLKPFIYQLKPALMEERPALFMKISTGSANNIKPDMLLDAFYASKGMTRPDFAYMVQREEVYADMAEETEKEAGHHVFTPLIDLGQDINP